MEAVLGALALTFVVGSLCGLVASARIGPLSRRIAALEARVRDPSRDPGRASHARAVHGPAAAAPLLTASSVASAGAAPLLTAPSVASDGRADAAAALVAARAVAVQPVPRAARPTALAASAAGGSAIEGSSETAGVEAGAVGDAADPAAALPVEPPSRARPEPREARINDWWKAFELRAGTRWTSWLGAAAIVIAAGLFVRHAIHQGWLGPALRLALGTVCGAGLLLGGLRAQRAEMKSLAHGLFGAGLGVLYVSTYVAFASHGLIPRELAFSAMVTVTLIGCVVAVWFDAQVVAVLALLGGLITPVAVSSGEGSRDALFTYLMVLDVGVVVLAMIRRWRALEMIAMVGTWLLFAGWLETQHVAAAWREELAWLAGFHVLFLVLPFGYHLRRQIALAPGRFTIAFVNAAAVSAGAAYIVDGHRAVLGVAALVMAASYHALGAIARRRLAGDGRAHFGFVAFAVVFATASIPLLLRDRGITLAWSLEAPVLLALGFHYRHFPIRIAGLGVLALAAGHLALHAPLRPPLFDLGFVGAMMIPAAAFVYAAVHRALGHRGDDRDRWLGVSAAVGGLALAMVLVHVEIRDWLLLMGRAGIARAVAPVTWAIGALIALGLAGTRPRRLAIAAGAAFTAVAGVLAVHAFGAGADPTLALVGNARFGAALLAIAAAGLLAVVSSRRDADAGRQLWIATLVGLGVLIGAEAYYHYAVLDPDGVANRVARARAQTAVTIAWAGYAAALLVCGFLAQRRTLRLAGLGLLGVVATKLVLLDLAGAAPLHRVLSFLVIGTLMIVASWAYHRLERRWR